MRRIPSLSVLLPLFGVLLLGDACSRDEPCASGTERCACRVDHSCNEGLVCGSDICVRLDGSSTGGNPGSAGNGSTTQHGAGAGPDGEGGASSSVPRGECIQVGFVGEDASDGTSTPNQFVDWLGTRGATVVRIDADDSLTMELVGPLHLLIVGNMTGRSAEDAYADSDVATVESWVERGGGLVTLGGYTADEAAMKPADTLLEPFGLGYDYEGLGAGVLGDGEPPMVASVVADAHPVVDGVSQLGVYFAYPVTGDGTVLLQEQQHDLARTQEQGSGRILAYGDEYSTFVEEWNNSEELQPERFWRQAITWLLEPTGCTLQD